MHTSTNYLQQLLQRYADNSCTREELLELLQIIERSQQDDELHQALSLVWQQISSADILPVLDKEKIFRDSMATPVVPVHRIHFLKTSWFRYAAAIILLLGAGSYFWFNKHNNQVATTNGNKHLQTDVAPGGNKAILTLADGSKIVLDNAQNGNLAQQGNTKVIKLSNGELAYSATNPPNPLDKGELASASSSYNTIATPRGGQYQIVLPDGSKVWLNAASSIKFPTAFTGNSREVEITGEAYLEVAKNAKQPFYVHTSKETIEVLGTNFNVNAYGDEQTEKTTLIEGKVFVGTRRGVFDGSGSQSDDRTRHGVFLQPGQQAELTHNSQLTTHPADLEQTLAWKNGVFQFNRTPLPDAMRQLARWYNIEVVYEKDIPDIKFWGKMQRNLTLNQVLRVLSKMGVNFRVEGEKLIVM